MRTFGRRGQGFVTAALHGDSRFRDLEVRSYDWNQTYTADQYRQLMRSYSGTQLMEAERRQGLLDDMVAFIEGDFDGRVTRPIVVTLTLARAAR